jgi:hypothetical protein
MGQFVGMRVVAATQDFRDEIIGGHGARNSFGVRGMAGYLPNQWNYFIGTPPVPVSQNGVGRWIFTQGESRDWVQITHADPGKAYEWAAKGRELHVPDALPEDEDEEEEEGATVLTLVHDPGDDVVSTLAAGAAYLGIPEYRFEKRRTRTKGGIPGEFKVRNRIAWRKRDLDAWNARWAGKDDDADSEVS